MAGGGRHHHIGGRIFIGDRDLTNRCINGAVGIKVKGIGGATEVDQHRASSSKAGVIEDIEAPTLGVDAAGVDVGGIDAENIALLAEHQVLDIGICLGPVLADLVGGCCDQLVVDGRVVRIGKGAKAEGGVGIARHRSRVSASEADIKAFNASAADRRSGIGERVDRFVRGRTRGAATDGVVPEGSNNRVGSITALDGVGPIVDIAANTIATINDVVASQALNRVCAAKAPQDVGLARLIITSNGVVKPGTINVFETAVRSFSGNRTIATDQATGLAAIDAGGLVFAEINGGSA